MYLQKQFQVNQNLRTSFELEEFPCGHMHRWRQLLLKSCLGTSLVVQWVRFCLPMQGMQVRSLIGELRSTCLLAKKQNLKQKQYYNKFNKDLKKKSSPVSDYPSEHSLKSNLHVVSPGYAPAALSSFTAGEDSGG